MDVRTGIETFHSNANIPTRTVDGYWLTTSSVSHIQGDEKWELRFIDERDFEKEKIEAFENALKKEVEMWMDRAEEGERLTQKTKLCVDFDGETQEKYDLLVQAQLEKVSAEAEMQLLVLSMDHISRDSELNGGFLSDEEKRENELKRRDIEDEIARVHGIIAQSQTTIDLLNESRARDRIKRKDNQAFEKDLVYTSEKFSNEVRNYTAFTHLLHFAKKPVFTQGVTQVSWFSTD